MKNINQYVITHKKIDYSNNYKYKLLVGAYNKNKSDFNDYLFDDAFVDNISSKNQFYCELTGLYYIWKTNSADYVSLEHYRRFFSDPIRGLILKKKDINLNKESKLLNKYDLLLPKKAKFGKISIYNHYCQMHYKKDIDALRKIIEELYPDYLTAFDQAMDCNYMYPFNMFIMRKELLNEYCKFLFGVLFELEKITDISKYDNYQKRIYGFLSERLMNVFVIAHKDLRIKEMFVAYTESSNFKNFIKFFLK